MYKLAAFKNGYCFVVLRFVPHIWMDSGQRQFVLLLVRELWKKPEEQQKALLKGWAFILIDFIGEIVYMLFVVLKIFFFAIGIRNVN